MRVSVTGSAALRDIRSEDGLTLIELMIVTVILGILVMMVAGPVQRAREKAMLSAAKSQVRNALSAAEQYAIVHGTAPAGVADLAEFGYRDTPDITICSFSTAMSAAGGQDIEIQARHQHTEKVVVGRQSAPMVVVDVANAAGSCGDGSAGGGGGGDGSGSTGPSAPSGPTGPMSP